MLQLFRCLSKNLLCFRLLQVVPPPAKFGAVTVLRPFRLLRRRSHLLSSSYFLLLFKSTSALTRIIKTRIVAFIFIATIKATISISALIAMKYLTKVFFFITFTRHIIPSYLILISVFIIASRLICSRLYDGCLLICPDLLLGANPFFSHLRTAALQSSIGLLPIIQPLAL